jgi:hypothetical protein
MISAVFGAFHLGARCYERGERIADETQDRIYGWEQIARQVRSTYPYKSKKGTVYFEGDADSLDFVSAYSLRWGGTKGLMRVSYRIRELDEGEYVIDVYEEQLLDKDQLDERIDKDSYETLARSDKEPSFQFFKKTGRNRDEEDGKWVESWDEDESSLPARVALVLGDADPEEDVVATMQMALQAQTAASTGSRAKIRSSITSRGGSLSSGSR